MSIYLYTKTNIGTPKKNIYTYIHSDKSQNLFTMYEAMKILQDDEKENYYEVSKSESFKNISVIGYKYIKSENDIEAQEKFFFNVYDTKTKLSKEIEINNIEFVFGVDAIKVNEGIDILNLGFPVIDEKSMTDRFKYNLILQLVNKKIIDSYDWFISYDNSLNDNSDNVIKAEDISKLNPVIMIGAPPHYYNKELYQESQLLKTNSDLYFYSITFKDVYLYLSTSTGENRKISIDENTVELYLEDIMIYAPFYYINIVRAQYFLKYKECNYMKDPDLQFYCIKGDNFGINELKLFPKLYFENTELNYTFELDYKDLFIEMNGRYYFLVTENSDESWSIGFPLLKKYKFVFNQNDKTVGFYNPNLPEDKEKETDKETEIIETDQKETDAKTDYISDIISDSSNVKEFGLSIEYVILIASLTGLVFIAIGILIGKYIFKKMKGKKRANELQENFDYEAAPENIIN